MARWLLLCCLLWPRIALAQATPEQAKRYFEAGAAAYTAGDYRAAVQALEAAYRLQPLPAIAFSLAQAERREYFVSRDRAHLTRAIELYHQYLSEVPTGGRGADATDALAQLEPLALAQSAEPLEPAAEPPPPQTRIMVRCQAPDARIALDGAEPEPAPLIAETAPGSHRVRAEAAGFFPVEQQVTAVEGELVPIEVVLRERPALVVVSERDGAEVYVDGVVATAAAVAAGGRLSLAAGTHTLAFAKKGREPYGLTLALQRGETRRLAPELNWTGQRIAAITLFAVAGAALATGGVFTGLALHHESSAHDIERRRRSGTISPAERTQYEEAVDRRDRSRIVAVAGLAVGASAALVALLLYQLDDPSPEGTTPTATAVAGVGSDGHGLVVGLGMKRAL